MARELSLLRRAFSIAKRDRVLRDVPTFPRLREARPRSGLATDTEIQNIVNGSPLWFHSRVVCGAVCGFSSGELKKLRVAQVDLTSRTILLGGDQTKNSEARTVPMTKAMYLLLSACVQDSARTIAHSLARTARPSRTFAACGIASA